MNYTLDNIDLTTTYGFIPGTANGSNMAVSGCWDLPKRIGKTYHEWAEGFGIEPYVLASEIRFEGRSIWLEGFIKGTDDSDAADKIAALIEQINDFTGLVELDCDWGIWDVLIDGEIITAYEGDGNLKISIPFREPEPDAAAVYGTAYDPSDSAETNQNEFRSANGIDGVSFATLGLTVLKISDYLNRTAPKPEVFTAYQKEGFQITRSSARTIGISGAIQADDYTAFNTVLNDLKSLFSAAGLRYLTIGDNALGSVFCVEGYQVSQVINDKNQVNALFNVQLIYQPYEAWTDKDSEAILDELNNVMYHED